MNNGPSAGGVWGATGNGGVGLQPPHLMLSLSRPGNRQAARSLVSGKWAGV